MKRLRFTCLSAAFFLALHVSGPAVAEELLLKLNTHSEPEAAAIEQEFHGRHDYHALMALKLARIVPEEIAQEDIVAARQFLLMAKEHAIMARKAK